MDFGNTTVAGNGTKAQGNFGQFQAHSTYTDFNTNPAYWGWNYVQGSTNAPNATSSQWYRQVISLGSDYPARGSGGYSLELAYPRFSGSSAGVWMRTVENGTIGGWTRIDGAANVSGTTNYVSKFTSANVVGNSQIFDNGTNVGIGTTSPSVKLEVRSDGLGTWQGRMGLSNATSDKQVFFGNYGSIAGIFAHNFALNAWADLYINTVTGSTGMVVKGDGNVGIGTTGPAYKLDVAGDIRATNKIWANANGASYFRGGDDAELWDVNVANTLGVYGVQNSDRATIRLGSGGSDISGLNGNIGIGTTNPAYRLDLANGTFGFGNGNQRTETRDNAGLQGNSGAQSGFFETSSPSNYPSGATSWWHLIDSRHSNPSNNYAMQFAGSFFDQRLYFRKTNNDAGTAWSQVPVAMTGSINASTTTTIYSDDYVSIQWNASNYQPQFQQKLGSTIWWDVTWNMQNGSGTQYRDGDDIYATNATWYYFSDGGSLNTNLNLGSGSSYGSDGTYWLGCESNYSSPVYSAYKIDIFRRGSAITYTVTRIH